MLFSCMCLIGFNTRKSREPLHPLLIELFWLAEHEGKAIRKKSLKWQVFQVRERIFAFKCNQKFSGTCKHATSPKDDKCSG